MNELMIAARAHQLDNESLQDLNYELAQRLAHEMVVQQTTILRGHLPGWFQIDLSRHYN